MYDDRLVRVGMKGKYLNELSGKWGYAGYFASASGRPDIAELEGSEEFYILVMDDYTADKWKNQLSGSDIADIEETDQYFKDLLPKAFGIDM